MSYKGRIQFLCADRHYLEIDYYSKDKPDKCHCGTGWISINRVDDTNGEAIGYMEPEPIITEDGWEQEYHLKQKEDSLIEKP